MSKEIVPSKGKEITRPERQQVVFSPEQTEEVINDIERMLNLIQQYQRALQMLHSPDPNTVEARKVLNKYHMVSETTHSAYRIMLDGRDITDFPDSLPGSAEEVEVLELEEGDDELSR